MATISVPYVKVRPLAAYLSLAKARAILPHLLTAVGAMVLAAGGRPPVSTLVFTLLGGACLAAAANVFNSYLDRDIDGLMLRTRNRPLPTARLRPNDALALGVGTGLVGAFILNTFVNWVAATLAVAALAYYAWLYTSWLKRRTCWSAVIGSGVGALPPLVGWAAVTNRLGPIPLLLAAIVILWTLPHFWALAFFRRSDYERAGLRTLPEKGAASWIIACSLLLAAATLLLAPAADLGLFYVGAACLLDARFLYLAARIDHGKNLPATWRLYRYSIFYIAFLFGAMIVDRLVL